MSKETKKILFVCVQNASGAKWHKALLKPLEKEGLRYTVQDRVPLHTSILSLLKS